MSPSTPQQLILSAEVPHLDIEGSNWAVFVRRLQRAMAINGCWGHFDSSDPRPVPKDWKNPTDAEVQAIQHWDREDDVAGYLMSQRLPDAIIMDIEKHKTTQEQWEALCCIFSAKTDFMQTDLHQSFIDMKCPKGGDIRKFLTDLKQQRHHLTAIGIPITDIEYKHTILCSIPEPLASYASQTLNSLTIASRYTCKPVDILELIDMISKEAKHTKSRHAPKDQTQAQGKGKTRQSDKALTATNTSEGGNSKHRKGKCHHCNKEGHWAHECCTRKREEATAENQSSQTAQSTTTTTTKPKNKPVGSANAFEDDLDDNSFFMANEDAARVYPYCVELDPLGESEDKSDDNVDEWEAFCTETWGTEDEDDLNCTGLDGRPVKKGEGCDVKEEAKKGTPRSESQLAPCTALHAPQIGDGRLQTTSSSGEQVAETMHHAHHLHDAVCPPEHAHLDDPKPAIHTRKGQTPGFNAITQAHRAPWPGPGTITKEQDVHPASAALLEGEEMWMPSVSSEQTAALGTPSTSNALTLPALPSEATPSSSVPAPELDISPSLAESVKNAQQELALTLSRIDSAAAEIGSNPDPQPSGNGLAHSGTDDPRLAHILDHPGAFAEDLGESGGVLTVETGASSPIADPDGAALTFAAETTDAGAPTPHTPVEAKRSHNCPPWDDPILKPVTHKARAAVQTLSQMGGVNVDDLKLSSMPRDHLVPPLIDLAPASAAVCNITCDVPQREVVNTSNRAAPAMRPATTLADANGVMAIHRHAKPGHTFPIDGSTMPPLSR